MPPERAHEAQRDPGAVSCNAAGGPETRENLTPKLTLFSHRFLRLFGFPLLRQGGEHRRGASDFQQRGGLRLERSCLYVQNRTFWGFMQNYLPQNRRRNLVGRDRIQKDGQFWLGHSHWVGLMTGKICYRERSCRKGDEGKGLNCLGRCGGSSNGN